MNREPLRGARGAARRRKEEMRSKSKITLFQTFFLSFAYVFSGLFLIRERSLLSLLVPLAPALFYAAIGYCFLCRAPRRFADKGRWLPFLSCGRPHLGGRLFTAVLTFFGAAELILSWLAFSDSVHGFEDFISFSLAAVLILALAVFTGAHGLTAVGRFSELSIFLILPLCFWIVFFHFVAVDPFAFSKDLHACLVVLPSAVLYIFSMSTLRSTAVPSVPEKPILIPLAFLLGVLAAILCAFLFLLYGAGEGNIFWLLFGWAASLIRLSLLVCVCTEK